MPSNVCPSQEELSVYILGKLRTDRSEEIDVHLQSCNDCQASLETLSAHSDTLLSGLHQREPAQYVNEPQCQQALARVQAIGCDPSLTARQQSARAADGDTYPRQIGPYRLLAELGRGGMGAVYKALHTKLDRVVALKVLPPDRVQSADAVARFEREMKAVGKLDHPNIVRASDADEEQGLHYSVQRLAMPESRRAWDQQADHARPGRRELLSCLAHRLPTGISHQHRSACDDRARGLGHSRSALNDATDCRRLIDRPTADWRRFADRASSRS